MALLPNVAQIAGKRKTYVYAFFRLCKLHNIRNGNPEDFFELPSSLQADPTFRSGLFRLAASVRSSEPDITVQEVVVIVALAVGGAAISAADPLEVPDELMQMFRSELGADEKADGNAEVASQDSAAAGVPSPAAPPTSPAAPSPLHVVRREPTQGAEAEPVAPQRVEAADMPFRSPVRPPARGPVRPPILQQALLADSPEPLGHIEAPAGSPSPGPQSVPEFVARPAPEAGATVEQLESARVALEQRVQQMEHRLTHVVHELEGRSTPARTPAAEAWRTADVVEIRPAAPESRPESRPEPRPEPRAHSRAEPQTPAWQPAQQTPAVPAPQIAPVVFAPKIAAAALEPATEASPVTRRTPWDRIAVLWPLGLAGMLRRRRGQSADETSETVFAGGAHNGRFPAEGDPAPAKNTRRAGAFVSGAGALLPWLILGAALAALIVVIIGRLGRQGAPAPGTRVATDEGRSVLRPSGAPRPSAATPYGGTAAGVAGGAKGARASSRSQPAAVAAPAATGAATGSAAAEVT
ncbi:MAG: hypothetical protein M3O02_01390, partial [Acidobacteriota bacterium]|nr:hypothetical protein [Acidobacteriota bacterium]